MIKLIDLLLERDYPKGEYVPLSGEELEQAKGELFDLVQTAYAPIGGHLKINSPNDIMAPDISFWMAADIDDDPELDVTYFGKNTSFGVKHTGMGHDGKRPHIKHVLIRKTKELKSPGNYVEVSGDAYRVFHERGGVPIIDDEEKVRAILGGKDITWYGAHPQNKKPGNGWYSRKIGGKDVLRTMIGNI